MRVGSFCLAFCCIISEDPCWLAFGFLIHMSKHHVKELVPNKIWNLEKRKCCIIEPEPFRLSINWIQTAKKFLFVLGCMYLLEWHAVKSRSLLAWWQGLRWENVRWMRTSPAVWICSFCLLILSFLIMGKPYKFLDAFLFPSLFLNKIELIIYKVLSK